MHNLPLYLLMLSFLVAAVYALVRRRHDGFRAYRAYLVMLVPAMLLPVVAVVMGAREMPRHEVVIHGYRLPVAEDQKAFYIGSDPRDDLVLHHRIKDRELLARGLVEIQFSGNGKEKRITQTRIDTPNIVSVDGRPLRILPLTPGTTHRISFGAFAYSDADKDVLEVSVPPVRRLFGDLALCRPEFRFRGRRFTEGFSHEVFGGLLPAIASREGQARHLSWRKRIFHKALDGPDGSLLKQASLMREGGTYYLCAADADIRLDGAPFPNAVVTGGAARLTVESNQLGGNRYARTLKILAPTPRNPALYFQVPASQERRIKLPTAEVADRICLSAGPSAYSQAYDIMDDQFPERGMLLSREGDRFVFRGTALETGRPYACGKVVFSVEEVKPGTYLPSAWYGLLFMCSAFLVPASYIRRVPLLGPLLGTAVFLHGVRQMIAFRAWQGPPYNMNVFLDSAAAPYLLVLACVVLTGRTPFYALLGNGLVRVWNFAFPRRSRPLGRPVDGDGARATPALLLYGLVLYAAFSARLGTPFLLMIGAFAGLSVVLGVLAHWERILGARSLVEHSAARYVPMLNMLLLFGVALISAPLLGGREIIPFLPGRLRPDILIQLVLLVLVAYQAGLWERDRYARVTRLFAVLAVYVVVFLLPLLQGVVARDMGFFLVAACPLMTLLLMAGWNLDRRIKALFAVSVVLLVAIPVFFKIYAFPLDGVAAQRIAFWIDKPRLRAEQFFDYQAQVPILWSGAQGLFGGGYFLGDWYDALRGTAVNDNVASVFVQGELGGFGSVLVMALYAVFSMVGILFVRDNRERVGGFRIWLVLGIALTFIWTAAAMFLQNLGYMPLTGKNLPFLGLDSLNDTLRYGLLTGLMTRYMRELEV